MVVFKNGSLKSRIKQERGESKSRTKSKQASKSKSGANWRGGGLAAANGGLALEQSEDEGSKLDPGSTPHLPQCLNKVILEARKSCTAVLCECLSLYLCVYM